MLETLDELEGEFSGSATEVSGLLRVTASTVLAQHQLVPRDSAAACAASRALRVELVVGDQMLDLARDGIDIAVRTASAENPLPDAAVARRIGTLKRALYAAPSYLAAAGLPQRPEDLSMHRLVTNGLVTPLNRWPFMVERKPQMIVAEGHWRTNDTNLAATMVLQGLGIGRLATLVGDPLVRQKLLVPVLTEFVDARSEVPVFAITARQRHRLPKIRACIDYWAEWLGTASAV